MRAIALGAAFIFFSTILVSAQEQEPPASSPQSPRTIERTFAAEAGKAARIGVYINLKPDCTSGALPILRLTKSPQGGRVVIKRAKIQMTNGVRVSHRSPRLCRLLSIPAGFLGPTRSLSKSNCRIAIRSKSRRLRSMFEPLERTCN